MDEKLRTMTVETYDRSARALAEYFRGIGPRTKYIDYALELAGASDSARVFEIGCGDGRDAKDIIQKSAWYHGIDISKGLLQLANEHVPEGLFEQADMVEYNYPEDIDVVFAFASVLHLPMDEFQKVIGKVHGALKPGGIFYISLKWKPEYAEEIKEDAYGSRAFYFYNEALIERLAEAKFTIADTWREVIGKTDWLEIALRKT